MQYQKGKKENSLYTVHNPPEPCSGYVVRLIQWNDGIGSHIEISQRNSFEINELVSNKYFLHKREV